MIEKRGYLNLVRQFDESHPTVSAIAPLICFAALLTVVVLLRLIHIFGAVTARCVGTDEFWYTSTGNNWPLAGSFLLVLFLLFAWNVFIGFDDWKHSKGSRIMVIVNAIGIAIVLYVFGPLHDMANLEHHSRAGTYGGFEFRPYHVIPRGIENVCVGMRRYPGRWRVVDREIGHYMFNIPADWIELKPWGVVYAMDANSTTPYTSTWRPPQRYLRSGDTGSDYGKLFGFPWDFDLQGDTLILTSPDYAFEEWERSRIKLERVLGPTENVFPNPYTTLK